MLELRLVSHPLIGLLSQSPNPVKHISWHRPTEHIGVALWPEQMLPHEPQLATLFRFVSHPLPALKSQFPKPALQAIPHCPAVQDGVPLLPEHEWPQLPQLATSVDVLTSQPSAALASQFARPAAHAHFEALQVSVALQSLPAPQVSPSVHAGHVGPPQSMSVSPPFLIPSEQVGGTGVGVGGTGVGVGGTGVGVGSGVGVGVAVGAGVGVGVAAGQVPPAASS